jgi:hypothetical protein
VEAAFGDHDALCDAVLIAIIANALERKRED